MGTWREYYAPQIAEIIKDNAGKTVKELRRILYRANPGYYGHMKKIWSDESLKQLGLKPRKANKMPVFDPQQYEIAAWSENGAIYNITNEIQEGQKQ